MPMTIDPQGLRASARAPEARLAGAISLMRGMRTDRGATLPGHAARELSLAITHAEDALMRLRRAVLTDGAGMEDETLMFTPDDDSMREPVYAITPAETPVELGGVAFAGPPAGPLPNYSTRCPECGAVPNEHHPQCSRFGSDMEPRCGGCGAVVGGAHYPGCVNEVNGYGASGADRTDRDDLSLREGSTVRVPGVGEL